MNITSTEIREKFLRFFESKGHKIIDGASLIPENDPTVLFTTAGMQPLVPYLLGNRHPEGKRLADVQKCVRTVDIDEVGDFSHLTFFQMLGNWSLGDYFKKDAILWSWEFLTSPRWLNLSPDKLVFTVFAGDREMAKDTESYELWKSCGVPDDHIFFLADNWWFAGSTGPCGTDTEMFLDTGKPACSPECSPACNCGKYLEFWNNVFMEFNKLPDGSLVPLAQKNVDTGMGLERTVCTLNGVKSVYDTDVFEPIIACIEEISGKKYDQSEEITKAFRIIADHIRCATFILGDDRGIPSSNVDQGYVLRRLIRRAQRYAKQLEMPLGSCSKIARTVVEQNKSAYPELERNSAFIYNELDLEEGRFERTLAIGLKEFEKLLPKIENGMIDGSSAFHLYDTFGFPLEFTVELAHEKGLKVDVQKFHEAFKEHQLKSQAGAEGKFKGGLAESSEQTAMLHTATHLLHTALRKVLGGDVAQKGSNITAERLRFDFSFGRKMTPEELAEAEKLVNEAIAENAPIICEEMTLEDAKKSGAIGLFGSKYDSIVKVYTMGEFSKEICGGPHAQNTGDLVSFKIQKEESSSAGVRRIKAVIGAGSK